MVSAFLVGVVRRRPSLVDQLNLLHLISAMLVARRQVVRGRFQLIQRSLHGLEKVKAVVLCLIVEVQMEEILYVAVWKIILLFQA
jgi:hypothetical protein